MKSEYLLLSFVLSVCTSLSLAQSSPSCGQNSFYQSGTSGCIWMRASNSNTLYATGCPQLPTNATGLAIGPAFTFSAPNPAYWTVGGNGNYFYYNGSSWVDTGHSSGGAGFINPGAGSSVIYNLKSDGQISVYNGTGNATLLTSLSGFSSNDAVQDIAADQYNNFYLLKASSPQMLVMYNSSAVQTCTYAVSGADFGGGLAISAGKVHLQTNWGDYYIGSLSNGTITFSDVSSIYCQTTDLANCPGDAGIFTEINASPSLSLSCAVSSILLSSSDPSGIGSYTWTVPGNSTSIVSQSVQINAVGIYTRSAMDCAGIAKTSTIAIGMNNDPLPIHAYQSGTVFCQGSAPLTLSVSGHSTYQWLPATGLSSNTGSVVQASPGVTTSYTVYGTLNACINNTVITVISDPLAPPVLSASHPSICLGSSSMLSAQGGNSYTWMPSGNSNTSLTVSPNVSTNYTLIASDQYGCSASNTIAITVIQTPTISVTVSDPEICATESVVIFFSGAENYTLQPGNSTNSQVVVAPPVTTAYTLSGANWQCPQAVTFSIEVNPLPQISISSSDSLICDGETVTLTASGALAYNWITGQTTSYFAFAPQQSSTISVSGIDQNGCSATSSFVQAVNECLGMNELKHPKLFTFYPNPSRGSFTIQSENYSEVRYVQIINIMGEQLLEVEISPGKKTGVSTEKLSPGIYFLQLLEGNQLYSSRLIVE